MNGRTRAAEIWSAEGDSAVEIYRRAIENPSDQRKLAKAIVDEMQNRAVGLSLEEARQVALAENSDLGLDKFYDEAGHEVDPSSLECEECGSKRASRDPPLSCASCGRGIDPRQPQCECGSKVAIPSTLLNAAFECQACGFPVDPSTMENCPNCNHPRAIPRRNVK